MDILDGLNDAQRSAVVASDGPVLILAGAGSGKTKTLTHRIAYLLTEQGVWPNEVLAVTFTNKAAREMRQRLWQIAGQTQTSSPHTPPTDQPPRSFMPWMGTFHGICVRILRRDGAAISIPPNFVIYDEDDRQGLIKQAMKQLSIGTDRLKPRAASAAISKAKNQLLSPSDYAASARFPFQQAVAEIYQLYEQLLADAGALDFDDLLLETVRLLRDHSAVRQRYQAQFKHILVDEYQDTNAAQYQIIKLLVNSRRNICVVGDDWQSIYSWRGADFTNILNFERDFPGALVVKLEQNYRSTGAILEAAGNVINKNQQRTDKTLWTAAGPGAPVHVQAAYDEAEEAYIIASQIATQVATGERDYSDFAVLYRTNAQSYAFERAFNQQRVPYQLVGGVRFYDRREIKDILAYLRLIYQPNDRVSFSRIANVPTRGIGATSLEKFLIWQGTSGLDIISALVNASQAATLTKRAQTTLTQLGQLLRGFQAQVEAAADPSQLIDDVITKTGYRNYILDGSPQADDREANLSALLSDARAFASMPDFLEEVALMSSADQATGAHSVTLMTLHAAKGLEFPVVYMVGLEDGLFPSARALEEGPAALEEERRLCYVGMTRARQELYMSYAQSRLQFGSRSYNSPSRFLDDMGMSLSMVHTEPATPVYDDALDEVMPYEIGDMVRSLQFGDGEVIDIDGMAVSVRFANGSTKKLNVQYARLEKITP